MMEHEAEPDQNAMEHDGEHDHDEAGAEHSDSHVPNNGAVVTIVSPQGGAEIKAGSDIKVEIESEGFELGADGNHWHIFVDGESRGMIMGADYDEVVRGLEPGEHQLGAFLSNGVHEELEDGATITITVVE